RFAHALKLSSISRIAIKPLLHDISQNEKDHPDRAKSRKRTNQHAQRVILNWCAFHYLLLENGRGNIHIFIGDEIVRNPLGYVAVAVNRDSNTVILRQLDLRNKVVRPRSNHYEVIGRLPHLTFYIPHRLYPCSNVRSGSVRRKSHNIILER